MPNERLGQYEESIEATLRQLQAWVRAHRATRPGIRFEPSSVAFIRPVRRGSTCELWSLVALLAIACGAIFIPIAVERGWIGLTASNATLKNPPVIPTSR
jgi:hypothetical protein